MFADAAVVIAFGDKHGGTAFRRSCRAWSLESRLKADFDRLGIDVAAHAPHDALITVRTIHHRTVGGGVSAEGPKACPGYASGIAYPQPCGSLDPVGPCHFQRNGPALFRCQLQSSGLRLHPGRIAVGNDKGLLSIVRGVGLRQIAVDRGPVVLYHTGFNGVASVLLKSLFCRSP